MIQSTKTEESVRAYKPTVHATREKMFPEHPVESRTRTELWNDGGSSDRVREYEVEVCQCCGQEVIDGEGHCSVECNRLPEGAGEVVDHNDFTQVRWLGATIHVDADTYEQEIEVAAAISQVSNLVEVASRAMHELHRQAQAAQKRGHENTVERINALVRDCETVLRDATLAEGGAA